MTATIIKFPVVKLPAERPLRRKDRLRYIYDSAVNLAELMKELGLRPENLSPNMDPTRRRLVENHMGVAERPPDRSSQREERLRAIFRLADIMKDQGLRAEDFPGELDPNTRRLIGLLNSDGATGSDGDTVA